MIKRSFKYVLIALINIILLFLLLNVATYDVRLILGLSGIARSWVPLIFVFFGSLIGMGLMVSFLRKRIIHLGQKPKVICAILLTFLLSSYYYLDFSVKTFRRFHNLNRETLMNKIEPFYELAHGFQVTGLTLLEYKELLRWKTFPEISDYAENIDCKYAYDGFLADYILAINYRVPVHVRIELIDIETSQFTQSQSVEIEGDYKLVNYFEARN